MSIHPLHLVAIFLICLLSHNLIADTADPSDYSGALILEGNGDYENAIKSYKQAIENCYINYIVSFDFLLISFIQKHAC